MKVIGLLVFGLSIISAYSYDMKGKWGFGLDYGVPSVQGTKAVKEIIDPNSGAAIRLRYHFKNKQALQIEFDRFAFDDSVTGEKSDFENDLITLNYLIGIFKTHSKWYNYASIGIGAANVKQSGFTSESDYWRTAYKIGLGIEYFITRWWNVGLSVDYHMIDRVDETRNSSEQHFLNPTFSTTIYFGQVAMADADKDGVADQFDKCDNSPTGSYVDNNGCADSQRDTDNDGVNDKEDKCTTTPETEKVDVNGCSASQKDSDNDGVADKLDQCPNTEAGTKVNSAGCTEKETVDITININFSANKADIDPRYEEELHKVALFLKAYMDTKAEIAGHTDDRGNVDWNTKLSEQRAEAVKQHLVEKYEINPERLTAVGYGPSQPIADNNTIEGRQKNRRVVATFKSQ